MTLQRMEHSGNAATTNLSSGISPSDATLVVVSGAGYPTGAVGPFVIVVDADLSNEEKVLCSARSTNNFSVASGGRGYDGTTPTSHSANAVVKHVFTANEADDVSDHIYNTVTRDDHTMYLTVARHDITARHTFGAAFTVPLAALTSAVGDAASPGVATGPARADHLHGREPWGVGLSTAIPPNTTAADGTSTAEARADHVHSRAASESFTNLTASGTVTAGTLAAGATTITGTASASGIVTAPAFAVTGLTGATAASRYVGATASGAPTSGTFAAGDFVIDQTGYVWVCTVAGSPGTWASEAAQAQKISARAYRNAGWSAATNGTFPLDVANYDTSLCFNPSPGRFTCPIAGIYQVMGAISCPSTASGQVMVGAVAKVAGPTVCTSGTFSGASSAAGQIITSVFSDLVGCVPGDVLEMYMQFNPSNLSGTTGSSFTYLAVQYLHP